MISLWGVPLWQQRNSNNLRFCLSYPALGTIKESPASKSFQGPKVLHPFVILQIVELADVLMCTDSAPRQIFHVNIGAFLLLSLCIMFLIVCVAVFICTDVNLHKRTSSARCTVSERIYSFIFVWACVCMHIVFYLYI